MTAPLWLADPGIRRLLDFIVDRLDEAEVQGKESLRPIKLDAKSFPALFDAPFETDKEFYWICVEQIAALGWFRIKLDRLQPGLADYERRPRLDAINGAAVRQATGRPERVKSAAERWRDAVFARLDASDAVREIVARHRIEIPDRNPEEIVERLNRLPVLTEEALLLREVSARLFWGQSKCLDKRQALVAAMLGAEESPFPEMPIQIQAYLPTEGFDAVLFVENLATFEQAARDNGGRFARLALIYAAGFKGSAKRLRSPGGASVYFAAHGSFAELDRQRLLAWLREDFPLPAFFWGDLDDAGMQILVALRNSFAGLDAWEPGYRPMLEALDRGEGHPPDAAGKTLQKPIESTGSAYADHWLIPALRRTGKYVDQEVTQPEANNNERRRGVCTTDPSAVPN